ncbi:EAL domain-containing protein [Arthrobacter sp. AL08]|uniref:EAL domain-containing protein n=1 Tax=Micrococcaceae TaxID=1268 RepID=UPI001CFFAD8F|nr:MULTISPECIES: EAL domain-containing protein [Micrococcaceae]MDI3239965.1 EAL domain-containing protein [Arthrobacter sp. AL05]MDI3275975.1 EAL domain-containing protein [Arthrobacter sp. AL08]MDJ0352697.1 EAL domain-containing protein [Pseudarthrobacter sp. PH31-O2]WGZ78777.1 EAL domain-containing protein [Arthrobacter sp. EM1]
MSSPAAGRPSPAARAPAGPHWEELLAVACRGDGLAAAFQPIVDTARGSVVGYEALARFPGFTEQNPEVWFSAARDHGKSAELESAALRTALAARSTLPTNCFLTLNVSPELLGTEEIRSIWREEGNLGGLIVELTEQTPIDSYVGLEPDLNQLRAAGALIAVDDAGAGYAGLRHLLSLRPSLIKIDRDLIQDVDRDEAKRALIEMLGTFASRVDAWILAEGVERVEELDALVSLGVPLVQGYYLARPAPAWAGIDLDLAHRLASKPAASGKAVVRDVLESATTASTVVLAAEAFAGNPGLESVVLIGEHLRPVSVLTPAAAGLGVVNPGMRVNLDTPLSEALARSMTRSASSRFEPLLVTDNAGRYAGVARLERMITALATPEA